MSRYDRGAGYGRRREDERDERGFFDRAADEVRSWFGDDEAERRRERDERYDRDDDHRDRRHAYGRYDGYDDRRRYADPDSRTGIYYRPDGERDDRRSFNRRSFDRRDDDRRDDDRRFGDRFGDRSTYDRRSAYSRAYDDDRRDAYAYRDDDRRRDESPREQYLEERYDRDYNRQYVRDFGDHQGFRGRFEGRGAGRSGARGYDRDDDWQARGEDGYGRTARSPRSLRDAYDRSDPDRGRNSGFRDFAGGSDPRYDHRRQTGLSRDSFASRGGYDRSGGY